MADSFSPLDRFNLQAVGSNPNVWGLEVNNVFDLIEQNTDGLQQINFGTSVAGSSITATVNNGQPDQSRIQITQFTGTPTSACTFILPALSWSRTFNNQCGQNVTVTTSISSSAVTLIPDQNARLWCDGTNVFLTELNAPVEQILVDGSTSGTISILPQAVAGTYNLNLPTTAGTAGYYLTSDGGGAGGGMTWTQPVSPIPSGTVIGAFIQAAAPTGWTQVTTYNDAVLRFINDSSGSSTGGNWTISGCTVGNTAITQAQLPNVSFPVTDPGHTHGVTDPQHSHSFPAGGAPFTAGSVGAVGTNSSAPNWATNPALTGISINSATTSITVNSGGSGQTHTHTFTADGTWRPSYVNALAASKN